jgi:hypothetical protein
LSIHAAFGDKRAFIFTRGKTLCGHSIAVSNEGASGTHPQKGHRARFENTVAFLTTPGDQPTSMTLAGAMG